MAVLYAEHNRNIPHGNVVRIYFVITFIARVTNLSSLIGLQETVYDYFFSLFLRILYELDNFYYEEALIMIAF
jgi:hypothetical protein